MVHTVREALDLLRRDGWVLIAQEGSHRQFKHPAKPGKVMISGKPSRDVPPEIWDSILKQAGLK
jgi:predicted RNA binding protein YcfA (HicA-like mRNA interferase family)